MAFDLPQFLPRAAERNTPRSTGLPAFPGEASRARVLARRKAATCKHEVCDGNQDDPSYAYCDLPFAHAGGHHYVP